LQLGEQVNFVVKTISPWGRGEKVASLPVYPPQIWSSFVSFASFSTSMMGFMNSMVYYQGSFGAEVGFNVGILATVVLIGLVLPLGVGLYSYFVGVPIGITGVIGLLALIGALYFKYVVLRAGIYSPSI